MDYTRTSVASARSRLYSTICKIDSYLYSLATAYPSGSVANTICKRLMAR